MRSFADLLEHLCARKSLEQAEVEHVFGDIIAGRMSEAAIAAFLVALKAKGETAHEIAGAANALRRAALPFDVGATPVIDTCGTGGDGLNTINVSTAVAILLADLGLSVAKHGNRSVSSACGSADVLEACGVKIDAAPAVAQRCLRELGICFLFAPQYHPGVKHVMPVRKALGVRTLFNLLGPLVNPARPRRQVVGVYDPDLCIPLAETLKQLGCEAALVVHGGGLDELALHAPTTGALLRDGRVAAIEITPQELGVQTRPVATLRGGDRDENARRLKDLLSGGGTSEHQEVVAINAGAALWIGDRAATLHEGVDKARAHLSQGTAIKRLSLWAELSHRG